MSKITIKEIREKYFSAKEAEIDFKWTYYVRRPISYYMAYPFLRLNISATSVTMIWLAVTALACAFLITGTYPNMIIGTGLLELAVILDCVDGHIARFTRPTITGEILDTWAGEILLVSSILCIGIGLSNSSETTFITNSIAAEFVDFDNILFMYIGIIGAVAALSSWTVRLHWRTTAMNLSLTKYEPERGIRKSKATLVLDNIFHYSGAITMVMLVSAVIGILDLALIGISLIYGIYLIALMRTIVKKARAIDSQRPIK